MIEKYTIVTSYKFVQIDNPEVMKDTLKKLCIDNEVKGTILIASEGINFTNRVILEKENVDTIV